MLAKNLTSNTLVADLVSVDQVLVGGTTTFRDNYEILQARLQNQTATPGVTRFDGVVAADSFPPITSIVMDSSNFNILTPITALSFTGNLLSTGTILATQLTQTVPSLAPNSFTGLNVGAALSGSGGVNMVFGRASTTNNAGVIQWDLTNSRINISNVNVSATQIRVSTTEVNMVGACLDSLSNPYQGIRNSSTVTLNIGSGLFSSTLSIPASNLRQVFLSLSNIKYTAANAYLTLQAGTGSTWITTTAGTYNGITTSQGLAVDVWTNTSLAGILLTAPTTSVTAEHFVTVKLTRLEVVGSRQTWVVTVFAGCSNVANLYSTGSGSLLMQTAGATTLSSLRLLSVGGITTGFANLYVA